MMNKKKRRFDVDGRIVFIILATVVIAVTVAVTVMLLSRDTVKYDIVYSGVSGEGIIVRQETYTDLSQYEKLEFNRIIDGDAVTEGDVIVTAYKKGYIKNTLDKLAETEKSIVAYQNQSVINGYEDRNIKKYDFDIQLTVRRMSEDDGEFIELYARLCTLMSEREEYIKAEYNTESNTYLQQLYEDERSLCESLGAWSDVITADKSGVIGFYCDGAEQTLTPEKILSCSAQEIKNLFKEEYISDGTSFKIVESEKWYAVVTVESTEGFGEGLYYPVYVGNETEYEIGYLERIVTDKKCNALIFSFETGAEKYIDFRKTDINLGQRCEGYSLNSKFVKNGTVTVKKDGEKVTVPVEVLYSDGKRTVIKVTDELAIGQKVYR